MKIIDILKALWTILLSIVLIILLAIPKIIVWFLGVIEKVFKVTRLTISFLIKSIESEV